MRIYVLLVLITLLFGCAESKRCIKVEGSYLGADGMFEYCWDSRSTEKFGNMTFERSDGKKVITIDEEQARKINELNAKPGMKSIGQSEIEILLNSIK